MDSHNMNGNPASGHLGRVAVVTGGSSGIGRGICLGLQQEGARVFVLDVAEASFPRAGAGSPPIGFFNVDVGSAGAVDEAFDSITAEEGEIDYLVCCAAIFPPSPFLQMRTADWDQVLRVNLTGAFHCCRAALRTMRSQGYGRIVLFSSMLARTGGKNAASYVASKGGILGLGRTLALEVAAENIRVNVLSPGIIDTPQPRAHLSEKQLYAMAADIPLGRIGTVEDVVNACLFLLGDESSYVTGQDLRLNGGGPLV